MIACKRIEDIIDKVNDEINPKSKLATHATINGPVSQAELDATAEEVRRLAAPLRIAFLASRFCFRSPSFSRARRCYDVFANFAAIQTKRQKKSLPTPTFFQVSIVKYFTFHCIPKRVFIITI